jgi:hypothetical protein
VCRLQAWTQLQPPLFPLLPSILEREGKAHTEQDVMYAWQKHEQDMTSVAK